MKRNITNIESWDRFVLSIYSGAVDLNLTTLCFNTNDPYKDKYNERIISHLQHKNFLEKTHPVFAKIKRLEIYLNTVQSTLFELLVDVFWFIQELEIVGDRCEYLVPKRLQPIIAFISTGNVKKLALWNLEVNLTNENDVQLLFECITKAKLKSLELNLYLKQGLRSRVTHLFQTMDCSELKQCNFRIIEHCPHEWYDLRGISTFGEDLTSLMVAPLFQNPTLTKLTKFTFPTIYYNKVKDYGSIWWQDLLMQNSHVKLKELKYDMYYRAELFTNSCNISYDVVFYVFCRRNNIKVLDLTGPKTGIAQKVIQMFRLIQLIFLRNKGYISALTNKVFDFVGGDILIKNTH